MIKTHPLILGIVLAFAAAIAGCGRSEEKSPEESPEESIDMEEISARVEALMKRMSLEDKLNCLDGDIPFWTGFGEMIQGYNVRPYPAGAIPELRIEGIRFIDGPRGNMGSGPRRKSG